MTIEQIARVAHETNKAYCVAIGDYSQPNWWDAQPWQKQSSLAAVEWRLANLDASASAQHEEWLQAKYVTGWKYGEVKDVSKKKHPCCVPYDELPVEQKVKDALFIGVVRAMKVLL